MGAAAMMLEKNGTTGATAAPRRAAFGPAVWGWGVVGGLALWSLGFLNLPWWAALLLWWWPSLLFGAAMGWLAVALAKLVPRLIVARPRVQAPQDGPSP
jgi:hypothetical protein